MRHENCEDARNELCYWNSFFHDQIFLKSSFLNNLIILMKE